MKTGLFFETDGEPILGKGQVYFSYLALRGNEENATKVPHDYPINLRITENALEFRFRGFKQNEYQECLVLRVPLDLSLRPDLSINPILRRRKIGFDVGDEYSFVKKLDDIRTFRECVSLKGSKTETPITLYHHLLLDFLYDFVHSNVFSVIPNYGRIRELILNDVFLYALISKCEFHYLLNEFSEKYKKGKEETFEAMLLARLLFSAEQKWLSIIHDDRFGKVFSVDSIWFDNIEDEYVGVLCLKKSQTTGGYIKRRNWIKLLIEEESKNDFKQYSRYNKKILSASAKWHNSRYMFRSSLNCMNMALQGNTSKATPLSKLKTLLKLPPFFPFDIWLIILILSSYDSLSSASILEAIFYWSSGIISAVIGCIAVFWIERNLPYNMLRLFMPRLIIGLVSSWFVFLTSNTLMALIYNMIGSFTWWHWILFFAIVGAAGCSLLMMNLRHQISNYKVNRKRGYGILLKRVLALVGIAYVYSIIIGSVLTSSILPTLIQNEIVLEQLKPAVTNLIAESPETKVQLSDSDNNLEENQEVIAVCMPLIGKFLVFPRILLITAFSTVFFGAFIELLVHNKPITDACTPSDVLSEDV